MVVVGAALAGGVGAEGVADAASAPSEAMPVAPAPAATPAVEVALPIIVLDSPATSTTLITTRDLVVRGRVREGTGPVEVMLEAGRSAPMVVRRVYPSFWPAGRDRSQKPEFVAILPLPHPRPTGPAVVHIIAFDGTGKVTEILLRTIRIGALLDPTYGDGAARPPTGEDGLMGGITSGTNFAWQADGR